MICRYEWHASFGSVFQKLVNDKACFSDFLQSAV